MKLGIFFSNCDGIVGKSLDLNSLSKQYEALGPVKIAESFYHLDDLDGILEVVGTHGLDSVVLAGESPFAYRKARNGDYLFRCLENKGVNVNRIQPINLKNMVVLPHPEAHPQDLLLKAKLFVDVGIEKLKHSGEITSVEVTPRKAVAVLGANISGVALAQHLLDQGCKVFLIHSGQEPEFSESERVHIQPTFAYVAHHPRFQFIANTQVDDFYGFAGDYTLCLSANGNSRQLHVGAVVLSPGENDDHMIQMAHHLFHVDVTADGALASRDEVSARSRTQDKGVFIINPPKSTDYATELKFLAADGAAAAIIDLLHQPEVLNNMVISQVNSELCSGCGICVKSCIFHAVSLQGDPQVSVIDPKRCRGCGNCVAICPSDARSLTVCPTQYLFNAVSILSQFNGTDGKPKTLVLTCDGCGYPCLNRSSQAGMSWPVSALVLRMICGGQIDTQLIMHAFVQGFDQVVLMVCGEGLCHNIIGNVELERRVNLFREILHSRDMDPERVHVITTSTKGDAACIEELNRVCQSL